MTNQSGIELNASKTKILNFSSGIVVQKNYEIDYLDRRHHLKSVEKTKINGIVLQQSYEDLVETNAKETIRKMDKQLQKWSMLGKILICKTFAISQIIYLMQMLVLNADQLKCVNHLLYKFI